MAKTPKIIKAAQQVKALNIPASKVEWVHKVIIAMNLPKNKIFSYIERVRNYKCYNRQSEFPYT